MRLGGLSLAIAATLAGCSTLGPPAGTIRATAADLAAPERPTVEVALPGLSADQALDRAKAAFLAEGLAIASAAGGVLTSEATRVPTSLGAETDKRYTATVISEPSGARVVIAGAVRIAGRDGPWTPITSRHNSSPASDGYHGWVKVRRIAARLAGEQLPESE
jgi:hypothetical protein